MAARRVIGYYVHHHGRGHRHRMRSITGHLRALGHESTALGSGAPEEADPVPWVRLPADDEGADHRDPTARGRLHWAPLHDPGVAARASRLAAWVEEVRPELLVVDVSVETTLLARLCGVPVVVVAQPGRRDDAAHALAYDVAERVVAPWPAGLATGWPASWTAKTDFVGAISRFDGLDRPAGPPPPEVGPRRGLLLWGAGGDGSGERVLASLREGAPGWEWEVAGPQGRHLDEAATWRALGRAEVVVTHAGQNSVAEVAAARRRAVVLADERPFDEQRATARWLEAERLAATAEGCPGPGEWRALLGRALGLDPGRWSRWSSGRGGEDAALALAALLPTPAGHA